MSGQTNIVKFPYNVSRCVHSKKPRASKNGTPEERAAKVALTAATSETGEMVVGLSNGSKRPRRPRRMVTGAQFEEFVNCLGEQREAFMADVWKLLNRHFRKL